MVHPGWVSDRESLSLAVRETGWFHTSGESWRAAENAELWQGWIGVTDESTVATCNEVGLAVSTGENLGEVRPVTLARISNSA
jgi:hypothetical protein